MNKEELDVILTEHRHWLLKDVENWYQMQADLSAADLREADLRGADLSEAYLSEAYLRRADLRGADLSGADLSAADLREADLRGADLSEAYLSEADLREADLRGADLSGADLRGADLREADLRGADLSGAYLSGADLREAKNILVPLSCPEKGAFIGFKKANGLIVELEILSDAKRSSATGRKCRCNKAKVLSITSIDQKTIYNSVASDRDSSFIYELGKVVEIENFENNRFIECAAGIHFFITREEAERY